MAQTAMHEQKGDVSTESNRGRRVHASTLDHSYEYWQTQAVQGALSESWQLFQSTPQSGSIREPKFTGLVLSSDFSQYKPQKALFEPESESLGAWLSDDDSYPQYVKNLLIKTIENAMDDKEYASMLQFFAARSVRLGISFGLECSHLSALFRRGPATISCLLLCRLF